ncbi:PAS domain-containing protein [bacterium]|nr:PAS domain-containing protein [bacterium]
MLKTIRRFLSPPPLQLLLILVLLLLAFWDGSRRFRNLALDRLTAELESDARMAADLAADAIRSGEAEKTDALCKTLGRSKHTRFTIILADGSVTGDSESNPGEMSIHSDRPEIREAMSGSTGLSRRYSMTRERKMMYVAVPVERNGRITAVSRASKSLQEVDAIVRAAHFRLGLLPLFAGLFLAALSLLNAYRIRKSAELLVQTIGRYEKGDSQDRLYVVPARALNPVASALSRASLSVSQRLEATQRERDELNSILSGMAEGVLVLDDGDRIVRFNRSAEILFHLSFEQARGRPVYEILRNPELLGFIERIRQKRETVEDVIQLHDADGIFIQLHGTCLGSSGMQPDGIILVASNVTRLRKLENMRRDFVANVSHELKTPVTSIQGFVETLQAGALQNPKDAERFLGIIHKHTRRLNSMINDLLDLSRLEQPSVQREIPIEQMDLLPVLEDAVSLHSQAAAERKIRIEISCDENLKARINAEWLSRAVSNLIDNALKYSEPGGKVEIRSLIHEDRLLIQVQDWGSGIPIKRQSRLFERFYRVEPSRSREMGGTGLGLAIVKHIAQVHGGDVAVESEEGKGSVFSIILPGGGDGK